MEADIWQRIITNQGKRALPIKVLHQKKTLQIILIGIVKVNQRFMRDHKLFKKKAQIMFLYLTNLLSKKRNKRASINPQKQSSMPNLNLDLSPIFS